MNHECYMSCTSWALIWINKFWNSILLVFSNRNTLYTIMNLPSATLVGSVSVRAPCNFFRHSSQFSLCLLSDSSHSNTLSSSSSPFVTSTSWGEVWGVTVDRTLRCRVQDIRSTKNVEKSVIGHYICTTNQLINKTFQRYLPNISRSVCKTWGGDGCKKWFYSSELQYCWYVW